MFSPRVQEAEAKPLHAADELNVFISEFRVRGPNGADDEFIEIYNASGNTINTSGWKLKKSSGCGNTSTDLVTGITITLAPGQYYLFARAGSYSGSTTADATFPASSTYAIADDGSIALTTGSDVVIDQVGLCTTALYKEGSTLSAMSGTANQSYERKSGGSAGSCKDTDNNATDFIFNSSTSNPQNFSSAVVPCLAVVDASSSFPDGTYLDTSGSVIDIQLEFSNIVTVTGSPSLLMEVGSADRTAVYAGGSGTNTLTFNYTIQAGDNTNALDYASYNALALNGGSIFGATGDAVLVLPKPGSTGSLSDAQTIAIDNTSVTPTLLLFTRQNPTSQYTNADELTFRVTFSEAVNGVDNLDFVVTGPGTPVVQKIENGRMYDIKISGGGLDAYNGNVSISLAAGYSINDVYNNSLVFVLPPPTNENFVVDNNKPTVSIVQAAGQVDPVIVPANNLPINFTVTFNEEIDTSTFTSADIRQNGTATGITWNITTTSDPKIFNLSAVASGSGTLIPTMDADKIKDLAGNNNVTSVCGACDNSVTFNDTTSPTVTINQSGTQLDPTSALPINFTVQFSEPINTATFTTSDITQSGTATSVVWSITNSGDNKTFTLAATSSGYGTLVPSIAANRVTDLSGNNNTASTTLSDNSVEFVSSSVRSIIINEVAWAGTTSSLTDDEWIELYNSTNASVNVTGWTLKAADGAPTITLNGTIPAGGYFLLERDNDTTVSDVTADQIYTGDLSNSGEALSLLDGANKVIDTANGNGGGWPAGSSSTYGTMERTGTSADSDSIWRTNTGAVKNGKNANGGDILGTPKKANSPLPTPTPTPDKTSTPTPRPPTATVDPRPIINEILARPGFDWNQDGSTDVFDEFIEIKNLTSVEISLSNWKLSTVDGDSFTLPDVKLKPGDRFVFYGKQTNILLSDGGETVRLSNSGGKIYDAFTYELARTEDHSFCRLPDGNPGNSWFEDCIPTPNLTNTREGKSPTSPDNDQSSVCNLPDTVPLDFFLPECKGYGANIWNPYYWDQISGIFKKWISDETSKWDSFIE